MTMLQRLKAMNPKWMLFMAFYVVYEAFALWITPKC